MPFYEYQCIDCSHRFESLQKISDVPLRDCPECGQATLKKLISKASFRLKGSGWYETDFKNNGNKPASDSANQPDSDSANDTKKASKTADTTDSKVAKEGVAKEGVAKERVAKENSTAKKSSAESVQTNT